MSFIDRMKQDGTFLTLSKKERLQIDRLRTKLEKNLGSISDMNRLPAALFIVDTLREHIAVKEALKLKIPIFAMVDTNSDPNVIDYVIPSNDDASKSIDKIMTSISNAVIEGLSERKNDKENNESTEKVEKEEQVVPEKKATRKRIVAVKAIASSSKIEDKKAISEEE